MNLKKVHGTKPAPVHPPPPVWRTWRCQSTNHQPSHQDEPGGAVVEGVLAVAEDVRALLRAGVRAGVIHERLVVDQVGHLALALVGQLGDLGVGGGEGGRGRAVGQVLVDATVEDGGAEGAGVVVWEYCEVKVTVKVSYRSELY